MPDLDQQLRSLIDGSRPPIELDSVLSAGAPAVTEGTSRQRWWKRPVLGAAAVLLVAVTVALIIRDGSESVSTGPTDSTLPPTVSSSTTPPDEGPRVVVGPTEIGDLAISTSPLVPAVAPPCPDSAACVEGALWLQHELHVRNDGDVTIYIDDTRTGSFIGGDQVLVGDEGCGYAFMSEGGDAIPGVCLLYYRGATLAPGESHSFEITLYRDLPGMEPLATSFASWERELRFDTRPFQDRQDPQGTVAYIDIAYFGLVPPTVPVPGVPIEVTLWHCGIDSITFEGEVWEVPNDQEPFDGTNVPEWFVGHGTIGRAEDGDHLLYTDESGLTLTFVPDDGVEPPCA